jgi:hypothetical protein
MPVGLYEGQAFCSSSMIASFRGAAGIEHIHAVKDLERWQSRRQMFEIGQASPTIFPMVLRATDGTFSSGRHVLKTSVVQRFRRGFEVYHLHVGDFYAYRIKSYPLVWIRRLTAFDRSVAAWHRWRAVTRQTHIRTGRVIRRRVDDSPSACARPSHASAALDNTCGSCKRTS